MLHFWQRGLKLYMLVVISDLENGQACWIAQVQFPRQPVWTWVLIKLEIPNCQSISASPSNQLTRVMNFHFWCGHCFLDVDRGCSWFWYFEDFCSFSVRRLYIECNEQARILFLWKKHRFRVEVINHTCSHGVLFSHELSFILFYLLLNWGQGIVRDGPE